MIKRLTGARYMVMAANVPLIEPGGQNDFRHDAGRPSAEAAPRARNQRVAS
jgi:hypothetical protein